MAFWGEAKIQDEYADLWLNNFIQREITSRMSLWKVACRLAESLNLAFGGVIRNRMGIHVAGFDEKDGVRGPAFYHVHNGHYVVVARNGHIVVVPREDPPIREFRPHDDHLPRVYQVGDFPPLTRNGDFAICSFLQEQLYPFMLDLQRTAGFIFPYPQTLAMRGEFLRFWIKTVEEIYRLSNQRVRNLPEPATAGEAHIGGPISVLTISERGIEDFYIR